jgi:hypothetical protein
MPKWMIFVLVVVFLSVGWSQAPQPTKAVQMGRYQLIMHQGEMPRMNTFLLDTETGKVWMMVSAPDTSTFWEPMDKVDNETEEASYVRKHPKKPE